MQTPRNLLSNRSTDSSSPTLLLSSSLPKMPLPLTLSPTSIPALPKLPLPTPNVNINRTPTFSYDHLDNLNNNSNNLDHVNNGSSNGGRRTPPRSIQRMTNKSEVTYFPLDEDEGRSEARKVVLMKSGSLEPIAFSKDIVDEDQLSFKTTKYSIAENVNKDSSSELNAANLSEMNEESRPSSASSNPSTFREVPTNCSNLSEIWDPYPADSNHSSRSSSTINAAAIDELTSNPPLLLTSSVQNRLNRYSASCSTSPLPSFNKEKRTTIQIKATSQTSEPSRSPQSHKVPKIMKEISRSNLRTMRDDSKQAHNLKLESMFSFLPSKLIDEIYKSCCDAHGVPLAPNGKKTGARGEAARSDFHGVLVMADLVGSTVLSGEMEEGGGDSNSSSSSSEEEEDEKEEENESKEKTNIGESSSAKGNNDSSSTTKSPSTSSVPPTPTSTRHSSHSPSHQRSPTKRRPSVFKGADHPSTRTSHARAAMHRHTTLREATKLRSTANDKARLGAERLRSMLTKYFHLLVGVTVKHGGDVVRIAGDAIISIFADEDTSLKANCKKAFQSCLEVLRCYNNFEVDGKTLQVRLHIVIGSLSLFCVGGYQGRWEYMISGKPFSDIKALSAFPSPGELVMSQDCWSVMYGDTSHKLNTGVEKLSISGENIGIKRVKASSNEDCVIVFADTTSTSNISHMLDTLSRLSEVTKTKRLNLINLAKSNSRFEHRLKQFVPVPVTYHCDHQNIDLDWLEEATVCSAMFVTFKEEMGDLCEVQTLFLNLQKIVVDNHGIIKEFSMDDKGLVVVVGFGLQPNVVAYPSACACVAALEILESKKINGCGSLCIGIATGPVFCAAIGSSFRREFALVGRIVNLAARLAFFAQKHSSELRAKNMSSGLPPSNSKNSHQVYQICVDDNTKKLAQTKIGFLLNEAAGQLELKGIKGFTTVYSPTEPLYGHLLAMKGLADPSIIGRTSQKNIIKAKLDNLHDGIAGGLLVIAGPPGSGKTHMLSLIAPDDNRLTNLIVFYGLGVSDSKKKREDYLETPRTPCTSRSETSCMPRQAEGLNAWRGIFLQAIAFLRNKLKSSPGSANELSTDEIELMDNAFTKFRINGRQDDLSNGNDTVIARTFYMQRLAARYVKEYEKFMFVYNTICGTELSTARSDDLDKFSELEVCDLSIRIIMKIFGTITRLGPVVFVIDHAENSDENSLRLIESLQKVVGDKTLTVCCIRSGTRELPNLRLHIPSVVDLSLFRNKVNTVKSALRVLIATKTPVMPAFDASMSSNASGNGNGNGNASLDEIMRSHVSSNLSFVENEADKEQLDLVSRLASPIAPSSSSSSSSELAEKQDKQTAEKALTEQTPDLKSILSLKHHAHASHRNSIVAMRKIKRIEAQRKIGIKAEDGNLIRTYENERGQGFTILDQLVGRMINFPADSSNNGCNADATVLKITPFDFNETIALVAKIMGTAKVCNTTAAIIFGQSQGNAQYIVDFAEYLKATQPDGSTFGLPIKSFNKDMTISEDTTWTLHAPHVPQSFFQFSPPQLLDAVRMVLKSCSAQQVLILKVIAVVGGSDCPIFLLESLLEDAVLSVSSLADDLCELIAKEIVESNVVEAMGVKVLGEKKGNAIQTKSKTAEIDGDGAMNYITYTYLNIHCQTAIYNMMSFSRRQELHGKIARYYENKSNILDSIVDEDGHEVDDGGARVKSSFKGPINPEFLKLPKKSTCFLIHHHFMASNVEKAVAICKLIGAMEMQVWCGQYARKVLPQLPNDVSDAVLHRVYPVVRFMQGVNSVINALKKGNTGFASMVFGMNLISKRLIKWGRKAKLTGEARRERSLKERNGREEAGMVAVGLREGIVGDIIVGKNNVVGNNDGGDDANLLLRRKLPSIAIDTFRTEPKKQQQQPATASTTPTRATETPPPTSPRALKIESKQALAPLPGSGVAGPAAYSDITWKSALAEFELSVLSEGGGVGGKGRTVEECVLDDVKLPFVVSTAATASAASVVDNTVDNNVITSTKAATPDTKSHPRHPRILSNLSRLMSQRLGTFWMKDFDVKAALEEQEGEEGEIEERGQSDVDIFLKGINERR